MRRRIPLIVMAWFAACCLGIQPSAQADIFGTDGNRFTIDFVSIGNAGNAADTTGYGAVAYSYRMGAHEIPQDAIDKATASGMTGVTAGPWTGDQPAANLNWYEAAAFVNFLNTSSGKTAAYDLSWSGAAWSMALWSSDQAWTAGGTNLYRNKDAYYFLPSENEWYKAAYDNAAGSAYFPYPTGSSTAPTAVASGANAGEAVYGQAMSNVPAAVEMAGGLSPYGAMGQGGNVWEWTETPLSGDNNSATNVRTIRGGGWSSLEGQLSSSFRSSNGFPDGERAFIGLRVASIPEPSTYALLLAAAAGALWSAARKARLGRGVRRKIPQ
jgi:formylglycine-generating enzyme required for sulfatase activity